MQYRLLWISPEIGHDSKAMLPQSNCLANMTRHFQINGYHGKQRRNLVRLIIPKFMWELDENIYSPFKPYVHFCFIVWTGMTMPGP